MGESCQAEYEKRMKRDPRPTEDLITAALSEVDESLAWEPVCVLHFRGTLEVLRRAKELCQGECQIERRLGANILGQLGVPDRTFPRECADTLLGMLSREKNAEVLSAILIAFGHLARREAIEPASRLRAHPDPEVRYSVVYCLMGSDDPRAVETLIELSRDEDAHVRDWATFGLGTEIELDTPAIREALHERLEDADFDARCEAIVGLARRGDRRTIPAIIKELTSDCVGSLAVEAAALIAACEIHPYLAALQPWWDVDETLLEDAVRACSPAAAQ